MYFEDGQKQVVGRFTNRRLLHTQVKYNMRQENSSRSLGFAEEWGQTCEFPFSHRLLYVAMGQKKGIHTSGPEFLSEGFDLSREPG